MPCLPGTPDFDRYGKLPAGRRRKGIESKGPDGQMVDQICNPSNPCGVRDVVRKFDLDDAVRRRRSSRRASSPGEEPWRLTDVLQPAVIVLARGPARIVVHLTASALDVPHFQAATG